MTAVNAHKIARAKRLWAVRWLAAEGGYSTAQEVTVAMGESGDFDDIDARPTTGQVSGIARILHRLADKGYLAVKPRKGLTHFGVTAKCLPYTGA